LDGGVSGLVVASANVNGVRAAVRRGMGAWLGERRPDVLCLQEVRAPDAELIAALGEGWHLVHAEAADKGRAGVAVASRAEPDAVRVGLHAGEPDPDEFLTSGRWVELDLPMGAMAGDRPLTVISAYVHTGEADTPRQEQKYRFLDAVRARLAELAADGRHVLLTGDLNIAHREADLKNWRGNLKKSGFLVPERAWIDSLLNEAPAGLGFCDVVRSLAGEGPGPYSWWSWRGQAFDNDSGWRIDYQLATPDLGRRAVKAEIDRAATYAERWSDHAPVVVTYDL
jgi:exodeoxyribonuclease III